MIKPAKGEWIGMDLDGVLAEYHGPQNNFKIGSPILSMVQKCRDLLQDGWEVRIFTARVDGGLIYPQIMRGTDDTTVELYRQVDIVRTMIGDWCEKHIGVRLKVTCVKDAGMRYLFDDRAIQIETNTGEVVGYDFTTNHERILNERAKLQRRGGHVQNARVQKGAD